MGVELKSISQLKGMSFYIPSYQRGYRWTEQQVKDLLNDINEFKPKNENNFYCLQPIVVKDRKSESEVLNRINEKKGGFTRVEEVRQMLKGEWEVIDGQQRLTTIFLILKFLKEKGILENFEWTELYGLSYETRTDSESFITNSMEEDKAKGNIDFFHIWMAYENIARWWEGKRESTDFKENVFTDKLLNQTKFIWYESNEENPVKVFTRLNIGKISLTNAELIKALFLNRSNFNGEGDEHLKLRQQEIAGEWDNMEYTLQNDEFWLFLHDKGYDNPTRIDFIFDLICKSDKLGVRNGILEKHKKSKLEEVIGTDKYKTFRYFYEYFQLGECDIKICWEIVKRYFQTFEEWYDDLTLYHYIGYLIECKAQNIESLINEWNKCPDKDSFVNFLKVEVKKKIGNCPGLDYQYNVDGSERGKCKPILLFHNIQTVINQNTRQRGNEKYQMGTFYKFPFHLYKIESWDVEHINPNTENPEEDEGTREEWLINVYLAAENDTQKRIEEYFIATVEKKNELFPTIKDSFSKSIRENGNDGEWTQEDKNRIWNYTLLDSSTNRSYRNAIFSGKRRVIIGKDKGVLIPIPKLTKSGDFAPGVESKSVSSFIPPCTKQLFLKYYSPAVGDSNYWSKTTDAECYVKDIEKCINQLTEETK